MKRYFITAATIVAALIVLVRLGHSQTGNFDPVRLSPRYYTIRLENDYVRVLEYRLKPGEKEVMHSHPPYLVQVLSDAKLKATARDGAIMETTAKKGEFIWREPVTHTVENTGNTEFHAIIVELKKP